MNKRIANIVVLALLVAGTWGGVIAQTKEEPPDRAVVPLTDPSKPAKIEVSIMRGSITVKGYPGREIIVEARVREKALPGYLRPGRTPKGPWAVLAPPAPPDDPRSGHRAPRAGSGAHDGQAERESAEGDRGEARRGPGRTRSSWPRSIDRHSDRDRALNYYFTRTTSRPGRRRPRRPPA